MIVKLISILDLLHAYDDTQEQLHFQGAVRLNNQIIHNWKKPIAIRPKASIKLGKNSPMIVTEEILDYAVKSRDKTEGKNTKGKKQD